MIVECKDNVIDSQNVAIEKKVVFCDRKRSYFVCFFKCVQLRSESGVVLFMCIFRALLNRKLRISKYHTHKRIIGTKASHLPKVKFT